MSLKSNNLVPLGRRKEARLKGKIEGATRVTKQLASLSKDVKELQLGVSTLAPHMGQLDQRMGRVEHVKQNQGHLMIEYSRLERYLIEARKNVKNVEVHIDLACTPEEEARVPKLEKMLEKARAKVQELEPKFRQAQLAVVAPRSEPSMPAIESGPARARIAGAEMQTQTTHTARADTSSSNGPGTASGSCDLGPQEAVNEMVTKNA